MTEHLTAISKFLSYVLRHQPDSIGLALDEQGWANVADLITQANQYGKALNLALLKQVVVENDKQRFALSEDGLKIRANQGHSIQVDLALSPQLPPEFLYHGTATRFLDSILAVGLKAKSRQQVHLSADKNTALKVGKRHGKAVILEVAAASMQQQGFVFYMSANQVWLIDSVPVQFLKVL